MAINHPTPVVEAPAEWSDELRSEFARNQYNGRIGQVLVSQTDRVRVWSIDLAPGERLPFHRHVLDYFWTAVTPGKSLSRYNDGRVLKSNYVVGQTKHFDFGPGEFMMHDLRNIGNAHLLYTVVEFLESANPPLPTE